MGLTIILTMIKTWWKGVRGLLASVKELFTPKENERTETKYYS